MSSNPVIRLKPATKPIIKFGFAFQGFIILVSLLYIPWMIADGVSGSRTLIGVFLIGAGVIYFLVARNFLRNVFFRESITITPTSLIVSVKKWATPEENHEFSLDEIKYFGHAGSQKYTEHPMNNPVIDFTGLAVAERELQFLIDDGTIEIETGEEVLRFGKNMSSWDTEEIIERIEKETGKKFINKYAEASV